MFPRGNAPANGAIERDGKPRPDGPGLARFAPAEGAIPCAEPPPLLPRPCPPAAALGAIATAHIRQVNVHAVMTCVRIIVIFTLHRSAFNGRTSARTEEVTHIRM